MEISLSLLEATAICRRLTGNEVPIDPVAEPRAGDVPLYVSDCAHLFDHTGWRPTRSAERILAEIHAWVEANADDLVASLGAPA
jgi:CDP-paratose 2-epimerase